ncbi:hypothetical protein DFH27DRAFT_641285 [Peziza echinospora]|nr:hypothetical protein DFH27DRAFT_641285 [Peziza echinospora]
MKERETERGKAFCSSCIPPLAVLVPAPGLASPATIARPIVFLIVVSTPRLPLITIIGTHQLPTETHPPAGPTPPASIPMPAAKDSASAATNNNTRKHRPTTPADPATPADAQLPPNSTEQIVQNLTTKVSEKTRAAAANPMSITSHPTPLARPPPLPCPPSKMLPPPMPSQQQQQQWQGRREGRRNTQGQGQPQRGRAQSWGGGNSPNGYKKWQQEQQEVQQQQQQMQYDSWNVRRPVLLSPPFQLQQQQQQQQQQPREANHGQQLRCRCFTTRIGTECRNLSFAGMGSKDDGTEVRNIKLLADEERRLEVRTRTAWVHDKDSWMMSVAEPAPNRIAQRKRGSLVVRI